MVKCAVGMYVFLGGCGLEGLRLDGAGDRMMMGAGQSPKLFFFFFYSKVGRVD